MREGRDINVVAEFTLQISRAGVPAEAGRTTTIHMKKLMIGLIKLYQKYVSPAKGRTCRFYPSCSQYGIEAVEKHGAWQGLLLMILRIFKCHPFNAGGYDPVP